MIRRPVPGLKIILPIRYLFNRVYIKIARLLQLYSDVPTFDGLSAPAPPVLGRPCMYPGSGIYCQESVPEFHLHFSGAVGTLLYCCCRIRRSRPGRLICGLQDGSMSTKSRSLDLGHKSHLVPFPLSVLAVPWSTSYVVVQFLID